MAKPRLTFNKDYTVRKQTVFWPVDLVVKSVRDSFPSQSTSGWPENVKSTALYAARSEEIITYSENRLPNGQVLGYSTTPDQYLEISQDDSNRIRQEAMNKAIASFSSMKANMAAAFAERQSTIDMIANRSMQAFYSLRALKRGDVKKAIRIINGGKNPRSKKLAALHLEWAYGWSPFIGDLSTICNKEFPPKPEVHISQRVTRPVNMRQGDMITEGTHRSTCSFTAVLDMPFVASAEKLGLVNPALVAWELVPFSFIIDWFIPIGDYLDSLTTFAGYTITDKCVSENKFLLQSHISNGYGRTKVVKVRSRSTSDDLKFRPFIQNPISIAHAKNALALIRVLRKD